MPLRPIQLDVRQKVKRRLPDTLADAVSGNVLNQGTGSGACRYIEERITPHDGTGADRDHYYPPACKQRRQAGGGVAAGTVSLLGLGRTAGHRLLQDDFFPKARMQYSCHNFIIVIYQYFRDFFGRLFENSVKHSDTPIPVPIC